MRKISVDGSVQEMFPDWRELEPGEWSKNGRLIEYTPNRFLEIGLHREPEGDEYTLHVFDNDDVIFCQEVCQHVEKLEFVWAMTESEWAEMMINHLTKNTDGTDFYGKVCVGDLSIEFQHTLDLSAWYLYTNTYCINIDEDENDHYGNFNGIPYTMFDANIEVPITNSFDKFKKECEIAITKMIDDDKHEHLMEHAYKQVAKWAFE